MDIFSTDNKPNRGRVAIVSSKESFSVLGIKKKLQESGIEGIPVKPSVFQIEESVDAGDPIIYYLDDDIYTPRGEDFLNELKRLCLEEDRLVILVGAKADYEKAIETIPKSAIVEWFARPVDMDALITTVESAINGEISPSRRQHILIVDDDVTYMRMMHEWMKERYQVTMLDAGSAAIHWLMDGNMVDLILLDYAMPVMDGPEVLSKIRSNDKTKSIPVLYRTGMDDGIKDENSADGIVPKSEGKLCLINAVRNILE